MKDLIGTSSLVVVLAALAACHSPNQEGTARAAAPADRYDVGRMDLNPAPATLTTQRHVGTFSKGSALSLDAAVKPLDPNPVKEIQIDVTHKVIDLAPGVKFTAWTFGDQVPGPIVRVRVGDKVKFSMTNRSDEQMPAASFATAPMMHSMDFHAAMVSPTDKYRSIAPGQTISFDYTPNYPGVFMYHCGTPMVLEHIASGMYGMVIVEPREGYPTQAAREYAVVQSEFYAKPDPQNRKVDGVPLYVLDSERVRAKAPTHTVFNGQYNRFVTTPLIAKPGERVRMFVLNVGPSNTSSFHVVGTIFDRVWIDGNPDNQMRGMQTVLLGSSSAAIVEFIVPEAGGYVFVDHHFANASQGAVGILDASGKGEAGAEHHNIPATSVPTDQVAVRGKLIFESKCLACHSIGGGDKMGPDLYGVTHHADVAWLTRWLRNPDEMLKTDAHAKEMLAKYKVPMPNQDLSEEAITAVIAYFKWADENIHVHDKAQPHAAPPEVSKPASETLSAPRPGTDGGKK